MEKPTRAQIREALEWCMEGKTCLSPGTAMVCPVHRYTFRELYEDPCYPPMEHTCPVKDVTIIGGYSSLEEATQLVMAEIYDPLYLDLLTVKEITDENSKENN